MHVSIYVCMICMIIGCYYYGILYINNKQVYESVHIDLISVCVFINTLYIMRASVYI